MLKMQGEYQDNVFLSEKDPISGYLISAIPGLTFKYVTPKSRANLTYTAQVKYFSFDTGQQGTFDSERYDIFHDGQLQFETLLLPSLRKGMVFTLNEQYRDSQTLSQISEADQDSQNKYFTNFVQPGFAFELSERIKLLANYENEIVRFESESGNNSIQHVYGLDMEFYKSKTNFFGFGYQQTHKDFEDSTDYAVKEGMFDFERTFNRTWSGGVNISYQMRDYASNSKIADWSGLATTVNLKAVHKEKLNLELTYQLKRSSFDSTVSYRIDRLDLKNLMKLTKKLSIELSPFFQRDTYDSPPGRLDSLWGVKSQIAVYPQEHISLGIGYDHARRNSSEERFGYINNIYYLFFSVN